MKKVFSKCIKRRISRGIAFNVIAIIFIAVTAYYSMTKANNNEHISEFISGFQVGIFIGIQTAMLFYIGKYRKALKNENELKKLYIKETDQEEKYINDKIGGKGFSFYINHIWSSSSYLGFFNPTVFCTLVVVTLFHL